MQCRVIGALILRELHTRYGRENVGYLWLFAEPMLLATVIGLMHKGAGHTAYGADIKPLPFAVIGYTTYILFRGIVNRSEGSFEGNASLLYHRMVTVLDVTMARCLLEFAACFLTMAVMMGFLVATGLADPPARPLVVLAAWGLMFWYSTGQALLITAISYENRTVGRLVHPYSYFMAGLSGAFFQMEWLPHPFRDWLGWLPITSIFEMVRYGQFQSAKLQYCYTEYLIGACLLLTWIGMVALTNMRNRIHLS
ncbi:ABC transporter permease [Sphingomonas nostoxanthinifaciens]|nr:ABC transporter permease [Sphingomonas nostoxanthinifaciens]